MAFAAAVGAVFAGTPVAGRAADAQQANVEAGAKQAADAKAERSEATIAILGFNDRGPSVTLAPLRFALVDMLIGDVSGRQGLLAVERMHVDKFLSEYDVGQSGLFDDASVQRAGRALSATYLLTGDFFATPGELEVTARLYKTGDDKPIAELTSAMPESRIADLSKSLSEKVLSALDLQNAKPRPAPKPQPGNSPRVAVLAFKDRSLSPRLKAMESGFADILQGSLGMLKNITLVERKDLYQVLREKELTISKLADPQTAVAVGRLLGAERFVYGSFIEMDNALRIDARVVDVETAAILKTQSVSGPANQFDKLLEDLAMKLADDLIFVLDENTRKLIEAATPAHHLEAAVHWANAEHGFMLGRYAESAENSERVLLLEPDNVHAGKARTRGWYFDQNAPKVVEAASQVLRKAFLPEQTSSKIAIYRWLMLTCWKQGDYAGVIDAAQRQLTEFADDELARNSRGYLAAALIKVNRSEEAAEMLEQAIMDPKIKEDPDLYVEALLQLYEFHSGYVSWAFNSPEFREKLQDPKYTRKFSSDSKLHAFRSIEIFELIQEEGSGQRQMAWNTWAVDHAFNPPTGLFSGPTGEAYNIGVSPEKKIELLKKSLKVFGWQPNGAIKGYCILAQLYKQLEQWDEAARASEYVALHPFHQPRESLPPIEDCEFSQPDNWLDREIDAEFWMAHIQHRYKNQSADAIRGYQKLLYDHGVAHWRAPNAISSLKELGADFDLPEKAALVWGGGTNTYRAWQKVLVPMGYAVHAVSQYEVNTALLAQYDLVILVRTGMIPYSATDILAIRNYVASGGSLLCVVSPGWEHAAPSLHNPLLSFFGVHADDEMALVQPCTNIVPHEITAGTQKLVARNFVNLTTPEKSGLIHVDDKAVLAALPYRYGRVVVTSLGQWFLPDPLVSGIGYNVRWGHWVRERKSELWPLAEGSEVALPMLKNAIGWLAKRDGNQEQSARNRNEFRSALRTALKAQYGIRSIDDRDAALKELVAKIDGSPEWKEEALWAAAESSLDEPYHAMRIKDYIFAWRPPHEWIRGERFHEPGVDSYQQLLDEFPKSPLRPFASWRKADSERIDAVLHGFGGSKVQRGFEVPNNFDWKQLVDEFEKVNAAPGTVPWIWAKLRMGHVDFIGNQFEAALTQYEAVVNHTENGAERAMAQYGCAICYQVLNRPDKASAYFEALLAAPEVSWVDNSLTTQWAPADYPFAFQNGSNSYDRARQFLGTGGPEKSR